MAIESICHCGDDILIFRVIAKHVRPCDHLQYAPVTAYEMQGGQQAQESLERTFQNRSATTAFALDNVKRCVLPRTGMRRCIECVASMSLGW